MDRFTAQTLVDKLDRNLITLAEAKRYAKTLSGFESSARSKQGFIRDVWAANRAYADKLAPPKS